MAQKRAGPKKSRQITKRWWLFKLSSEGNIFNEENMMKGLAVNTAHVQ